MKKVFFVFLFLAALANSKVTQGSILGNWDLVPEKAAKSSMVALEGDSLKLTDDWKFSELAIYRINYPSYGPGKVDLSYKLKVSSKGQYRIENDASAIKKYIETFESEIMDASDESAAQSSLKEIEKIIRDEAKAALTVLSVSGTELELQGQSGNIKFTKPKKLPNSKLTGRQVPFFAPEGWRYPEITKELADYPVRLKTKDITLLTIAEADFNGDGHKDAVAYLINDNTEQVALFLNLSKPDGSYSLEPYGSADRSKIIENGVFLAQAGEYTNVSNKQKITIEHDGFMIVIFGTAATLVYFDSKSNNWQSVPIGKRF
ncbi:MAG: hypothetical protein LBH25_04760 [Fibromonadaceae bacterium]|jgi:hypothetical protein|nr:hypothetical protein [Fibromonadaceae bacterium]